MARPVKLKGEILQGDEILKVLKYRRIAAGLALPALALMLAACESSKTDSSAFFKDVWPNQAKASAPPADQGSADPLEPRLSPADTSGGIVPFRIRNSWFLSH